MSDNIYIIYFFTMSSAAWGEEYRFSSWQVNGIFEGQEYIGVGSNLVSIAGVSETQDLPETDSAAQIVIRVPEGAASAFIEDPRNAEGQLVMGIIAEPQNALGTGSFTELKRIRGFLSGGVLSANNYSFNLVSWRNDADRGEVRFWDRHTQRRKYPGDAGLDQTAELAAGLQISWPNE